MGAGRRSIEAFGVSGKGGKGSGGWRLRSFLRPDTGERTAMAFMLEGDMEERTKEPLLVNRKGNDGEYMSWFKIELISNNRRRQA